MRSKDVLDRYYNEVNTVILSRQNPATGLIPASVAITTHGDYTHAWTRDNVYSIMAVWGLALAYRRIDENEGRAYELENATKKCMRGLLFAMMRQAHKVELFKNTQRVEHSLHAKYSTQTGATVVGDNEWGHLQIDATSIFLLALAQMTAAGLLIVYTLDEVHFIQNLVFYIERAYRTPDYGIWERGNKINHGQPELNSSSIGMAVAALQALNGLNLFGARGGPSSVIHVLPDEITRNYTTLHSALPRESNSKEVDAAILSVISFPAFAVNDPKLIMRTRNEIVKKLGGRFGFKRFLRDGHQTVLEDTRRLHYDAQELKIFEDIECEWPLFFTYMILDGLFRGDKLQVDEFSHLLEPLLVDSNTLKRYNHQADEYESLKKGRSSLRRRSSVVPTPRTKGMLLVPELYYVPKELVELEKSDPGTVLRMPNENVPLVWAQSLYILGSLIKDDLLSPNELDPLGRYMTPYRQNLGTEVVVQIVLLAENSELQERLSAFGLETQTIDMCKPITISSPSCLRDAYTSLGANKKLGLTGRPKRPVGTLSTCRLYRCQNQLYAFLPHFMDKEEFYLVSDYNYLISVFEQELMFVKNHWWYSGRPTLMVMLTKEMLGGLRHSKDDVNQQGWRNEHGSNSQRNLLNFMISLRTGICNGVRVKVGPLSEMINTSCIESLDFLIASKTQAEKEHWRHVLKGEPTHADPLRLLSTENLSQAGQRRKSVSEQRGRSVHRKSISADMGPASPTVKNPLKSPFFSDEPAKAEDFKLKDHIDVDVSKPEHGSPSSDLRPGTPTMRMKSPRRGSSANRLARGSFSEDNNGSQNTSVASLDVTPSLSRRNSFKFDVKDMPATPLVQSRKPSSESVLSESGLRNELQLDENDQLLTLNLGDKSSMEQAVLLLKTSTNLYDQIDLLHYIHSCHGLDHGLENLGTVRALLEEVYIRAMPLKQWSVVRQAAGLLRKNVNSLTINVADLLIRGKPVTIGFGENEFFILNPLPPEVLSDAIFKHCASDIREAPLVQEILTYLGSLIRSSPHFFDGIQRIRTYFCIIAMREEISRMKGCDEEEAVEHLMHLSPFETKSLLTAVLSSRDNISSADTLIGLSTTYRWKNIDVHSMVTADLTNTLKMSSTGVPLPSQLAVSAQSAGFYDGNFVQISLSRDSTNSSPQSVFGRGLNVVVLDPLDGAIIETASFDTHISNSEADAFAKMVEWLEPEMIVVIISKDDCAENLTELAKVACESIGSACIRNVGYRDSWAIIGEKGAKIGTVVESHRKATTGPSDMLQKSFDLVQRRKKVLASFPAQSHSHILSTGATVNLIMPSNGRWLRRRKNDGALNRVPPDFYPRVWKVLSRCHGILLGKAYLPRDPTISEKTPEEVNFALQVESYMDVVRDPAERQVAVECLMVISRIADRNPEIHISNGALDLMKVIRDAIAQFWTRWVSEHGPNDLVASTVMNFGAVLPNNSGRASPLPRVATLSSTTSSNQQPPDLSFERNEKMARRLFFDLQQEGPDGTMAYLARSAVRICFDVNWVGTSPEEDDSEKDDTLGIQIRGRRRDVTNTV